ncbi:MAG: hypothetical protein FJY60_01310 [Betaproteobacteria bacterium]|nr:hypothetical protein [Betaproteobacteria bacterium]
MQLAQKQFLTGFENYLWRWKIKDFNSKPLQTTVAKYRGDATEGRVFLWAEQGVGDEIFYAGLLPNAAKICPKITLSADHRLHPIFKRSFPNIDLVVRDKEILDNQFEAHAPIGDLAYLLGLEKEEIARSRQPFLLPNTEITAKLKRLSPFADGKLTCGLSWRSANKYFGDAKSIALEQLAPLTKIQPIRFINLQYGDVSQEILNSRAHADFEVDLMPDVDLFHDIEGLTVLINACDVIVTTSNLTAHLAGAVGKRGCVLVPFSKGRICYWHLRDSYSFWYPSLKVF